MAHKKRGTPYYHYDFVCRGERYRGSTGLTRKGEADAWEAEYRRKIARGDVEKPVITLDEACGLYQDKVERKPSWPTTRYILLNLVEGLGGDRLLKAIQQRDLLHWASKRRAHVADSSVNRELEVARAVWRWAAKARYDVGDMPEWGALMLKVPNKAPREASFAEEEDLFEKLREDYRAFTRYALLSGWRLAEVRLLKWNDVDLAARVAKTRIKGGDVVMRALTNEMVALIANQPRAETTEGRPYVFTYVAQRTKPAFTDKKGRKHPRRIKGERYPFTGWGWRRPWGKALREAGIDEFRFHDLRHTRGTRILRATGNLAAAKAALAHKSIKTTLRYAHANDEDVRRALETSENRALSHNPPAVVDRVGQKAEG